MRIQWKSRIYYENTPALENDRRDMHRKSVLLHSDSMEFCLRFCLPPHHLSYSSMYMLASKKTSFSLSFLCVCVRLQWRLFCTIQNSGVECEWALPKKNRVRASIVHACLAKLIFRCRCRFFNWICNCSFAYIISEWMIFFAPHCCHRHHHHHHQHRCCCCWCFRYMAFSRYAMHVLRSTKRIFCWLWMNELKLQYDYL